MARAGMNELISQVRTFANAGTADYSDDTIQTYLDMTRVQRFEMPLDAQPRYVDGTTEYREYPYPGRWVERADTAEAFVVRDVGGSATTESFTVNYDAQRIVFDTDQGATTYYLDYRCYDVYTAAADIWDAKAAVIAETSLDWQSDNHRVQASKLVENYRMQAEKFRRMGAGGVKTVRRRRVDEIQHRGGTW